MKVPFCDVHVHFDCAGSHKVCFPVWLGLAFRGRRSTLKTSTNPSAMCMCISIAGRPACLLFPYHITTRSPSHCLGSLAGVIFYFFKRGALVFQTTLGVELKFSHVWVEFEHFPLSICVASLEFRGELGIGLSVSLAAEKASLPEAGVKLVEVPNVGLPVLWIFSQLFGFSNVGSKWCFFHS